MMTLTSFAATAPDLNAGRYVVEIGSPAVTDLNVVAPDFFPAMNRTIDSTDLGTIRDYLRFHLADSFAMRLPHAFDDENFDFYGRKLTGTPQQQARWKRCVQATDGSLGEALGQLYVEKYFTPDMKASTLREVHDIEAAMGRDIEQIDWMSPDTKAKAKEKLHEVADKIGYPDKWRDYSKLEIKADDLIGNQRRVARFALDYQLGKLGKPVDRTEWGMTPQTVNAYYNPGMNEIVFPAAILQPPFFDLKADDAVNYGGIGAVIGHEIGHGFDDQGSKYDGDGNLKDWWTAEDKKEFQKRTKALIEQYNAFEPQQLPGQHVNGALTIGENIGDLGGLTIAHKAYMISLKGKDSPTIDGFTGPQRFFIGWAQVWRTKFRDAALARRLATDPHSPAEFRCNGVVRNLTEFYEAFGVKEGDKLWLPPKDRVRIW
jgi:putative endopeptidase